MSVVTLNFSILFTSLLGSLELDTPSQPVNNHHAHSHTPVESEYWRLNLCLLFKVSYSSHQVVLSLKKKKTLNLYYFLPNIGGKKCYNALMISIQKNCTKEIRFCWRQLVESAVLLS